MFVGCCGGHQTLDFSDLTDADLAVFKKTDLINPKVRPSGGNNLAAVGTSKAVPLVQRPLASEPSLNGGSGAAESLLGDDATGAHKGVYVCMCVCVYVYVCVCTTIPIGGGGTRNSTCLHIRSTSAAHVLHLWCHVGPRTWTLAQETLARSHACVVSVGAVTAGVWYPRFPVSTAAPTVGKHVQERHFKGQEGFWGDIEATYQHVWDGEADGEDGHTAGKKWF